MFYGFCPKLARKSPLKWTQVNSKEKSIFFKLLFSSIFWSFPAINNLDNYRLKKMNYIKIVDVGRISKNWIKQWTKSCCSSGYYAPPTKTIFFGGGSLWCWYWFIIGKCHRFWFLTLPFTLLPQTTPTSNFGSHHVVTRSTRWALPVFADSSSDSDAASISQDRSFHFGKRGLWEISRITHTNDNNGCIFNSRAKICLNWKIRQWSYY